MFNQQNSYHNPASKASMNVTASAGTIACNGGSANVTVSASGGTAPYTGTGTFSVTAGTYTYSVMDATYGVKSTSITVSQPSAVAATVSTGTISVFGGTTTATVSASGGTAPYTYKLNNGNYQSSANFSGLAAGNHTITIKDNKKDLCLPETLHLLNLPIPVYPSVPVPEPFFAMAVQQLLR